MDTIISPLQRLAVLEGERHHMIFEPVTLDAYRKDWVYERIVTVPDKAKPGVDVLQRANFQIKTMYLAHEAPKLLPAPKEEPKPAVQKNPEVEPILSALPQLAMVVAEIAAFFLFGIFQIFLLDPAVIVELEDGSLLEVVNYLG